MVVDVSPNHAKEPTCNCDGNFKYINLRIDRKFKPWIFCKTYPIFVFTISIVAGQGLIESQKQWLLRHY